MAPSGRRPKPAGQAVTRHPRAYGWIDVEPVPFNGPKLPPRRRDGSPWPNGIAAKWRAWASMPHCRLGREAEIGSTRRDAIELAAAAFADGAKVGLWAELRLREKQLGTTWSARQDIQDPVHRAEQFAARDGVEAGRLPKSVVAGLAWWSGCRRQHSQSRGARGRLRASARGTPPTARGRGA